MKILRKFVAELKHKDKSHGPVLLIIHPSAIRIYSKFGFKETGDIFVSNNTDLSI